jgi:hypothetical protein
MIANAQERVLQADIATFPRYKTHAFLPTRTLHLANLFKHDSKLFNN